MEKYIEILFPSSSEIINTGEKNNIDHNLENGSLEKKIIPHLPLRTSVLY